MLGQGIMPPVISCSAMMMHLSTINIYPAVMAITQPLKSANMLNKTIRGVQIKESAVCILQVIQANYLLVMITMLDATIRAGCA